MNDFKFQDEFDKEDNGTKVNVALIIFTVVVFVIGVAIMAHLGCISTNLYCQI